MNAINDFQVIKTRFMPSAGMAFQIEVGRITVGVVSENGTGYGR